MTSNSAMRIALPPTKQRRAGSRSRSGSESLSLVSRGRMALNQRLDVGARRPAEHDLAILRASLSVDGQTIPSGSLGTIVMVHRDGKAFEVEFVDPHAAVVTLQRGDFEARPWQH